MPRPDPALFATLARDLAVEQRPEDVFRRIVDASVRQIDGADHAGVTILSPGSASTPAATDELVHEVDRHQYDLGEGPCLSAARSDATVVHAPDLARDERWPRFAAAVTPLGVAAMISFQMYTDHETVGALNVYSHRTGAFSEDSVAIGTLLAAHAALAVVARMENAHLRLALENRDVIGQAKGILMERYRLGPGAAFDLLVDVSEHTNTKLRDVARHLAETGDLDPEAFG